MTPESLAALAAAGFDVAHAFDANAIARELGLAWLAGTERRGILIGNTRALWPPFTVAMRDPALAAAPDPLDRYTEAAVDAAGGARAYYAHRSYDGAFLPFQRIAVATGFGALSDCGLVIHPVYGPWFALRAVVLVDDLPVARAPIAKPCACDAGCSVALATARAIPNRALHGRAIPNRALHGRAIPDRALHGRASTGWLPWLAVRDACALRDWRYSDDQIRYHYTKAWAREWGASIGSSKRGRDE